MSEGERRGVDVKIKSREVRRCNHNQRRCKDLTAAQLARMTYRTEVLCARGDEVDAAKSFTAVELQNHDKKKKEPKNFAILANNKLPRNHSRNSVT